MLIINLTYKSLLLGLASAILACGNVAYGQLEAFGSKEVQLDDSWIKAREDVNAVYLKYFDAERLLHNFRVNAGLESNAEAMDGWENPGCGLRGHFVGHYLSAMSELVARTGDAQTKEKLNYLIDELEKCQNAFGDGYLSAFPQSDFDGLENGVWVWAPYYTYHKIMQGLLDAYQKNGNIKALEMAKGMADYAYSRMSHLDDATKQRLVDTRGSNPYNETGGMNDVLYQLYQIVPDQRYIELAQLFDGAWLLNPLSQNKDVLSGLHSNSHIAIINGYMTGYETMHDQKHWLAAKNFWDILMDGHAFVNGSSSGPRPNPTTPTAITSEHWCTPNALCMCLTGQEAESCVSHNTMKLTSNLFAHTQDAKYADAYMNMYYNALLSLQNGNTGQVVYHLPLGSQRNKNFLDNEHDFRCCNGTSIEAFANLSDNIYFYNPEDKSIWINLYLPSTLKCQDKGIEIKQIGDITHSDVQTIVINENRQKDFAINMFIPSWCQEAEILLNGKKYGNGEPGSYMSINRKWKAGDKIELKTRKGFYLCPMSDAPEMVALFYGPMLLAIDSYEEIALNNTADDIINNIVVDDIEKMHFTLHDNGKSYCLMPLFDITDQKYTVYMRTFLP